MDIHDHIIKVTEKKGAAFLVLIDPDKITNNKLNKFVEKCEAAGVDGFLVGGSLIMDGNLEATIDLIKKATKLPVIIFPGNVVQVVPNADALLFISLISGRNADFLFGHHVLSAPVIKKLNIEPIATGYMIVESGKATTAEYMSGSAPIPRNKPEIAVSTALAAQYLGMQFIYLEGGSGAENPVPDEMVKMVSENCTIPVIVGGGIKNPETARLKVENGAKVIVIGNHLESEKNSTRIKDFSEAIHQKK
mgnify:CR=1 FL=1